jgi:indole-3-acetate monooxygenase
MGTANAATADEAPAVDVGIPAPLPAWLRLAPRRCDHPLEAARGLRTLIEAHADEAERIGHVPEPVVRALADAGLYGILIPRELGGSECHVDEVFDALAELAYADGSIGWSLMANAFFTHQIYSSGTDELVDEVFNSDAGYTAAGQASSLGRADRVDGGFRVSGLWHFGSGSREAAWFMGLVVEHADGEPVMNSNGEPVLRFAWTKRENVRLRGNWDVMGLVATGSYDYEFPEQVLPEAWVYPARMPVRGGPLFAIQVTLGHVTWALGVAKRILDELRDLARRKQRFGRQTLIDQPTFHQDFAMHEAMLEAAWEHSRRAFARHYDEAASGQDTLAIRAAYRLAGCYAVEVAIQVGHFAYLTAGSDALRNNDGSNRLQRCFRDIHAGSQHRHTDRNTLADCGRVLLGVAEPSLALGPSRPAT